MRDPKAVLKVLFIKIRFFKIKGYFDNCWIRERIFISPLLFRIGSISAGNPITSYIFGGELLDQGINLLAVTAFLVAWVTVGLVQLPAESFLLGKRFAILRNAISFIFSIFVAIITAFLVGLI